MKIKRREIIELSAEEKKAFDLVSDTLEEIIKEVDDPVLIEKVSDLNRVLVEFCCDYCEEF